MKAPREIKRWVAKRRSNESRGNGVVSWLWDAPTAEIMMAKNKRAHSRRWRSEAMTGVGDG